MKRLIRAIAAFYRIITADEWCIFTVKGRNNYTNADISLKNFRYISKECIDDTVGQHTALSEAKELLK